MKYLPLQVSTVNMQAKKSVVSRNLNFIKFGEKSARISASMLFKEAWSDFASNTSMHGIKYVVDKKRSPIERAFWLIIVFLGASGSFYMGSLFWKRYTDKPTLTRIETTYAPTSAVPFPALTICTTNRVSQAKIDSFISELSLEEEEVATVKRAMPQLMAFSPRIRPFSADDLEVLHKVLIRNNFLDAGAVVQRISYTCDEIMVKCSWLGKVVKCDSIFADVITPDGPCCAFNYNESKTHNKEMYVHYTGYEMGLTMLIDPMLESPQYSYLNSEGIQVVIHKRQQYPGMLMSRKALSVGKQNFLQLSGTLLLYSDELRMLPYSNRKCLYPEERHLKFFDQYDLLSCKRECVVLSIVENCECLPYFYRRLAGPIAPPCNLSDILCMASLDDVRRGKTPCDCPPACEDVIYNIVSSAATIVNGDFVTWPFMKGMNVTGNSIIGHIFFKSSRQTILRTHMLTATIYLLSSFGGIFSLFLGLSFITAVEFIYYFFIRVVINAKKSGLNKGVKPIIFESKKRNKVLCKNQTSTIVYPKKKGIYTIHK